MQADKFHKTGRQLRSKMWWQNMKMKVLVVSAEAYTVREWMLFVTAK